VALQCHDVQTSGMRTRKEEFSRFSILNRCPAPEQDPPVLPYLQVTACAFSLASMGKLVMDLPWMEVATVHSAGGGNISAQAADCPCSRPTPRPSPIRRLPLFHNPQEQDRHSYNVQLEVALRPQGGGEATTVTRSNLRHL